MKIDKSLYDDFAILTLKGEFDTFYCPKLQEEVDGLLGDGVSHIILNMRMVKFINSTALGAIIKAFKRCKAEGGQLVLAKPSPFAKDIISKLGINQLVPMFDDEEEAKRMVVSTLNTEESAATGGIHLEEGKVLVQFPDEVRGKQAHPDQRRFVPGTQRTIVATMLNVNPQRLQFSWSGKKNGLTPDQTSQLFVKGSDLNVKFQVRLFKKGYFELAGRVVECQPAADEHVKVTIEYTGISDSDAEALRQFAEDLDYLKKQLPG